jgi:hypothetical protein
MFAQLAGAGAVLVAGYFALVSWLGASPHEARIILAVIVIHVLASQIAFP